MNLPVIPDYELLRRIGGGAYGEVWLARSATGVLRAVKIVYRRTFEDDRPYEREFEGIQRFERVSREHPSQLALFHVGRNNAAGYFHYVMELADDAGELGDGVKGDWNNAASQKSQPSITPTLQDAAAYSPHTLRADLAQGRLPAQRVLELGMTLTEALAHLHENGLVHRDIKPSNIIFVGGKPKLADIGLVTDASDRCSIVGTEGYLPPEGPGTPQADIFALGKVLYEAATGLDRRELPKLPPDLRAWPDAKQVFELNEIILKAGESDPRKRYVSAEAMLADLNLLQRGESIKRKQTRKRRWVLGKRLALAASALVLLFVLMQQLALWRETKTTQATTRGTSKNEEARRLYELARWHFNRMTGDSFERSLHALEQATQLDPSFAQAYVLRAEIYTWTLKMSRHEIADRLLSIDPASGEAHAIKGWSGFCECNWKESEKELQLALTLNPNYAMAHAFQAFSLDKDGRFDDARKEYQHALELDPTSRMLTVVAAFPDLHTRQYKSAIAQLQKAIDLEPNSAYGLHFLSWTYSLAGDYSSAIIAEEKAELLTGGNPTEVTLKYAARRKAYEEKGAQGYWQHYFDTEFANNSDPDIDDLAIVYIFLGDKERALSCLENAFDSYSYTASWLKILPEYDSLRKESRFKNLLRRANFAE